MNIIKTLENHIAVGNNIILDNGNVVPDEKVKGEALKAYLAGIKDGKIPFTTSFVDYFAETKKKYLTVREVIAFIKDEDEDTPEAPEVNEAAEVEQDAEPEIDSATELEPEPETEPESEPEPEPKKKPVAKRRTRK